MLVENPLTIFGTPDLLSIFWRDEIDKLSQVVRLKIQKMKVTNCPESEEISIDLQVGDHRSLELKSLNYTKVFFVESKWNFQFQQGACIGSLLWWLVNSYQLTNQKLVTGTKIATMHGVIVVCNRERYQIADQWDFLWIEVLEEWEIFPDIDLIG